MGSERFTNARVHEWLTPALDSVTGAMHTTRLQLNSAALWWFLTKISVRERAEILGEYVKALALAHAPPEKPKTTSTRRQRKD